MELNKRLLVEIVEIFRKVRYGKITFYLSLEKKTLDYSVETTGKLDIVKQCDTPDVPWGVPWGSDPPKNNAKKTLTKSKL